jgi:hypothetical protein
MLLLFSISSCVREIYNHKEAEIPKLTASHRPCLFFKSNELALLLFCATGSGFVLHSRSDTRITSFCALEDNTDVLEEA